MFKRKKRKIQNINLKKRRGGAKGSFFFFWKTHLKFYLKCLLLLFLYIPFPYLHKIQEYGVRLLCLYI